MSKNRTDGIFGIFNDHVARCEKREFTREEARLREHMVELFAFKKSIAKNSADLWFRTEQPEFDDIRPDTVLKMGPGPKERLYQWIVKLPPPRTSEGAD